MSGDPTPGVAVAAPAKVNLFLRVRGRRPDGFHELETVFQAVSLADEVSVRLDGAGRRVALELDGPDLGPPEDNLAVRAARAFVERADLDAGVRVRLRKRIPAGGGLGGGSSDAAAVLSCLDRLSGGALHRGALLEIAAGLGSDVPFFLGRSPLSAARGRGEELEPWTPLPPASVVFVLPPVHVATGPAYGALARAREEGSEPGTGGPPSLPAAYGSWGDARSAAWNDFQDVVADAHPEVRRALEALDEAGGEAPLLSGSGAACFAFFPDSSSAGAAAEELERALGWPARAARTLERFPEPEAAPPGRG